MDRLMALKDAVPAAFRPLAFDYAAVRASSLASLGLRAP